MATVYYSDTLGTNLQVFEKKSTKGGEPSYYINLDSYLITDTDVEKLVKVIEYSIIPKPKVKQKKGKGSYQITWNYPLPTPLSTQQILFDVLFSWLKGYGYVDANQSNATKTKTTRRKTTPTLTTTTTNFYGVPLINVESNTSVINEGDLFYYYDYINSPSYITNINTINDVISYTYYVTLTTPEYEKISLGTLVKQIYDNQAFLCRLDDGGYFTNEDGTLTFLIEPINSDGSFDILVTENGVERKGGQSNKNSLALFICTNKMMPKVAPQKNVQPASNKNMDVKTEMFLVDNYNNLQRILTINPNNGEVKAYGFNPPNGVIFELIDKDYLDKALLDGKLKLIDLSSGDLFTSDVSDKVLEVVSVDTSYVDRVDYKITFNVLNTSLTKVLERKKEYSLPRFGDMLITEGYEYMGNANTYYPTKKTKFEVGDVFKYVGVGDTFIVTSIVDGKIFIKDNEKANAQEYYWVTVDKSNTMIEKGEITFIYLASNTIQTSTKIQVGDLLQDGKNDLKVVTKVDDLPLVQSVMITYDFKDGFGLTEGTEVEQDIKDKVIKLRAGQEFFNGVDTIIINNIIESWVDPLNTIVEYSKGIMPYKENLLKFGSYLVRYEYQLIGTQSNSLPLQVGDKFIWSKIPFKPTKSEEDDYRVVTSVNIQAGDLDYTNNDGKLDGTMDLELIRKYIKSGELIILNSATQTSNLTSLQIYDLYSRNADGKLFRVIYSYNGLTNIHNTDIIELEAYDSIAKNFITTSLSFQQFKENIETNKFTYIGRVKKGDSFINEGEGAEIKVVGFEYPDDVEFELNDISTTPPTIIQVGNVENLQIFTKSLLEQKYKFNYRLNTTNTSNTQTTPQPQIATIPKQYDTELDALKQKLSDLLFLKSILSDLDFEQKINVSTEISDVQSKIDVINGKIFEQRVNESDFFDNLFEQSFTPLKNRYDLDIMKNQVEEIISPSGEMSDFTEDMQNIINSKEFKNWFGDWRSAFFYRNLEDFGGLNISKVLNDKFEPQLVWHGTNNEFSYFKFDLFPANYFAVNKEYSEFFATNKGTQGLVLPFFLNIKNPLDFSHFGIKSITQGQFFDWVYLTVGMTPEELDVNPMFLDANIPPQPVWMFIRNNPTMLQKIAQAKVYDGIKFYEFNPNEKDNPDRKAFETLAYIVFDAHQVKLADPKRGNILLANLKSFMLKKGGKI